MRWFTLRPKPGVYRWWQFRRRWMLRRFAKLMAKALYAYTQTPDVKWFSLHE